ncbi:unnamed protein product [Strongylus vulgaris]|uniref:Reverse transcriptase domain-containing protein n=1 Tax=Strongylus vulgaris TaxID=40348 RepID=A0A3P7LVJ4_STRVU|nr:unnamed protein product [Strongylus vulgaris]
MKSLDCNERGIQVDGRFLSNLRFADDIVLFSKSIPEAETMLKEINEVGKQIGLRINRKKSQFMKIAFCEGNRTRRLSNRGDVFLHISRAFGEHGERSWAAFESLKEATDQLTDPDLRAHLLDSDVEGTSNNP